MTIILEAAAPTFHALTGTQKVGATQIATQADYVGSMTLVRRANEAYWVVRTLDTKNVFRSNWTGTSVAAFIWRTTDGRYVVDYWDKSRSVEIDRTRTLKAAIGVAATFTAERWATGPCAR